MRDYLFFNALVVTLVAAHMWTKTYGTPTHEWVGFFTTLWIISMLGIVMIKAWIRRETWTGLVDFDENLSHSHLTPMLMGLLAILLISAVFGAIAGVAERGVLWVPEPSKYGLETYGIGDMMDDVLFNIGVVSTAEESLKIVFTIALWLKLKTHPYGKQIATYTPIAVWALLHTYRAYVGPGWWAYTIGAFCSGVVMFYTLKKTKSILNPVIQHGLYNSLAIVMSTLH